ncbi:MAG: cytoplasmic protein [Pseudophaeobacter sp. bin_em_oilr2.035]|nr:cytoplasmic protein [Phaeobacter gallaeciensis]MDE4161466.1 cytoplasmic protein [Phaeobacter gallaeciensis]MDF1770979.1 cytoplasmic protein [Pseudophaeobacter sp. bin_em_oilr2.035]
MMDLDQAHTFSTRHRESLENSDRAGCFHCCAIFDPTEIDEWIEENSFADRPAGFTAMCPRCGIDAVLAEADVPLSTEFLKQMYKRWFDE